MLRADKLWTQFGPRFETTREAYEWLAEQAPETEGESE